MTAGLGAERAVLAAFAGFGIDDGARKNAIRFSKGCNPVGADQNIHQILIRRFRKANRFLPGCNGVVIA